MTTRHRSKKTLNDRTQEKLWNIPSNTSSCDWKTFTEKHVTNLYLKVGDTVGHWAELLPLSE